MILDVILMCLALNIYFEARSESLEGQYAVAEVTIRRASLINKNICEEVFTDRNYSWNNDEPLPKVENQKAWNISQQIAAASLTSPTHFSKGATHFHAIKWKGRPFPKPRWAYKLCHTVTLGNHIFYKPCGD